jgi:hypothetical protein
MEDAMPEPSDANLRAALAVLVRRAGGTVEISNTELYDAMMSNHGTRGEQFIVEETSNGIRLHVRNDGES